MHYRKVNKALSGALVGLMVLASLPISVFSVSAESPSFTDLEESNYKPAIEKLATDGVLEGYLDGTFKPKKTIQRDEFVKIIMETADLTNESAKNCFPDVKEEWYAKYVCSAKEEGIIGGYSDGYFHPERQINFVEASKIISRTFDLGLLIEPKPMIENEWYSRFVYALEQRKAIPTDITSLDYKINREQMSEIMWRINEGKTDQPSKTYAELLKGAEVVALSQEEPEPEYKSFSTCSDLKEHAYNVLIAHNSVNTSYGVLLKETGNAVPSAEAGGVSEEAQSSDASTGDYSTTNVQVAGVDEADIVKTDGQYIYVVKSGKVGVVKATPVATMEEIGNIEIPDKNFTPRDMYVDGDRLVVLGTTYDGQIYNYYKSEEKVEESSSEGEQSKMSAEDARIAIYPPYFGQPTSKVYVFDISDKTNLKVHHEVETEGDIVSSRKIGDTVYTVTNKYGLRYGGPIVPLAEDVMPVVYDSVGGEVRAAADCSSVLYHPGDYANNYMIVTAVPVKEKAEAKSRVIVGSGQNVYASTENLYVAETSDSWWWLERGDSTDSTYEQKTVVNKFSLDGMDIDYKGYGEVDGHILNQFSMDEHKGNFRIATTTGSIWDQETKSTSNVYVLDEKMKQIGALEGLAPGEQIYSSRFMGDRAYMVTFKKIDPLFVIDLENPEKPEVLGELKIPGYSDYLHPYDENHIIGFGKDAVEAGFDEEQMRDLDFAWYQGMKVAMFDVTDVKNPKELHKATIGDRGTSSPLLYDHKALMFAPEKGKNGKTLMAFPVELYEIAEDKKVEELSAQTYGEFVGQYAYVYDVSVEDGFELRNRLSQQEGDVKGYENYDYFKSINRILYIGDYLYTVSQAMVNAYSLDDLSLVKETELKVDRESGNWYPVW